MGCGTHAILQKKDDSGDWKTITVDVLNLCSSTARDFNDYMHQNAQGLLPGIPDDVYVDSDNNHRYNHEDYWLGEHSHFSITLDELMLVPVDGLFDRVQFEVEPDYYSITIPKVDDYEDAHSVIRALKAGFGYMFWGHSDYRLVVGFDS